jgi:acyl-CoA reductase-like NAD-dependent aldehyde dehydrogenase
MSLSEEVDAVSSTPSGTADRPDGQDTFESTDPATGAVVGVFPVHGAEAVSGTVARARTAAEQWAALGFTGRRTRLAAYRGHLARRVPELADLVHRENGKPHDDAVLEITLAIDHLAWAAAHAPRRSVPAGCGRGCSRPTRPPTWSTSRSASSA